MRLDNKAVVTTGGGSGIGAAIGRAFAEEGGAVAITDIRLPAAQEIAAEITRSGGRAGTWAFDASDQPAVEQAADQIEKQLGPIDIWVNNAGISHIVPFLECNEELWYQTLRINLKGTFVGCQAAIRRRLPRRRGVVLNMSSQSGKAGNSDYPAVLCQHIWHHRPGTISGSRDYQRWNPRKCPMPWYRDDAALGPGVGRLCTQAKPEASTAKRSAAAGFLP